MLALLAAIPWLVLPLLWLARRGPRDLAPWLAAAADAIGLALLLKLAPRVFAGEVIAWQMEWVESLGLTLSLRLDGLGFLFALLILLIGLLVILYARYYLTAERRLDRFFLLLMLFTGAMLGVVLAGNLLLMFVFWELTSISSFLLIGYHGRKTEAREGARTALAVTGGGGLALLAGVLLLGHIAGSFETGRGARCRRSGEGQCSVSADSRAGAGRRVHQVGADPVPLLAAGRHGCAHARCRPICIRRPW